LREAGDERLAIAVEHGVVRAAGDWERRRRSPARDVDVARDVGRDIADLVEHAGAEVRAERDHGVDADRLAVGASFDLEADARGAEPDAA
jgi:hypothetical protein